MNQAYIHQNTLPQRILLMLAVIITLLVSPIGARADQVDTTFKPSILPGFPVRHVVIIQPIANQRNYHFSRYMISQLQHVFKYPYYESTVSTSEVSKRLTTKATLSQIAEQNNLNFVIVPYALDSTYYQYRPIRFGSFFYDNDELYTVASIRGAIYYYDKDTDNFGKVEANYFKREEYLSVPSEQEIWYTVMNRLLTKLPYKRVPTDISRYEAPPTAPNAANTFNQVEQKKY